VEQLPVRTLPMHETNIVDHLNDKLNQLRTHLDDQLAVVTNTLYEHINEKTKQLALAIHTHGK